MKSYRPVEHIKVLNSRLITGSFFAGPVPRRATVHRGQTTILDHVPIMSLQRVISRPTDK